MRAVVITSPGGPDVLQLSEVPDPVPGEREVLVQVVAAGVNPADLLQRQGLYPPPPGASPYPGLECSGRIVALGPGVTGWRQGDEVCALLAGGGYADLVAVPQRQLLLVPPEVGLVNSAALPEAVCTVYSTVFAMARLKPGETLLVHGGAGGVGSMAIQLGKAIGAKVVCTAGTPEKLQRCRELGADTAVSYADDDFVAAVHESTSGRGADVVLDIMGASYFERNMAALATGGRLVVISHRGGKRASLDLETLMRKRAAIFAATLRARPLGEKARIVVDVRDQVWPLVASGQVVPVVDRLLPMAQAADAHHLLAAGTHTGKVLLLN